MQQHKVLDALENAINTNRKTFSGMPQAPIDYQTLWGEGVGPQVQLPPTTFDGAPLNNPATQPPEDKHPHMAGFAPLTGSQASAKLLQGAVSLFLILSLENRVLFLMLNLNSIGYVRLRITSGQGKAYPDSRNIGTI